MPTYPTAAATQMTDTAMRQVCIYIYRTPRSGSGVQRSTPCADGDTTWGLTPHAHMRCVRPATHQNLKLQPSPRTPNCQWSLCPFGYGSFDFDWTATPHPPWPHLPRCLNNSYTLGHPPQT